MEGNNYYSKCNKSYVHFIRKFQEGSVAQWENEVSFDGLVNIICFAICACKIHEIFAQCNMPVKGFKRLRGGNFVSAERC